MMSLLLFFHSFFPSSLSFLGFHCVHLSLDIVSFSIYISFLYISLSLFSIYILIFSAFLPTNFPYRLPALSTRLFSSISVSWYHVFSPAISSIIHSSADFYPQNLIYTFSPFFSVFILSSFALFFPPAVKYFLHTRNYFFPVHSMISFPIQ